MHDDRCEATLRRLGDKNSVIGIELGGYSNVYDWQTEANPPFRKVTLFPNQQIHEIAFLKRLVATIRACLASRARVVFLCHYEHFATLITAIALRGAGRHVVVMNDSKFDDYDRTISRELVKVLFYAPYEGALASGVRSRDYMRFLGLPKGRIKCVYNALSLERIQQLAGTGRAPDGPAHGSRHFTIVARLVEKKNLSVALEAYAIYCRSVDKPRPLHICGSGKLEAALRAQAAESGIEHLVVFRGFLQAAEVCATLGHTLALLLPSIEEQFGNVIIEAQALGVPVILSINCGARDDLVRTGVNGFVVEPDNARGMARFMNMLAQDEVLWTEMSLASREFVHYGDCSRFAGAVEELVSELEG